MINIENNGSDSEILHNCRLCPRRCGADRLSGQRGFCLAGGETVRLGRAALHFYEEPCISGEKGSGAVFFSGCNMRCDYCQNGSLSRGFCGVDITVSRLAEIFSELQGKGAHNINLVTPTHYVPQIKKAIAKSREELGMTLPVVYNTSGYELSDTIRSLDGFVDIYLPDFKYISDETAVKYSSAPSYAEYAESALDEMVRQCPFPEFDDDGMMKRGVIVRHLLLPGQLEASKRAIAYLHGRYGDRIYISIMSQYTPQKGVHFSELESAVPYAEYEELVDYAVSIGVTNGFIQDDGTADDSFIPSFDGEGVLRAED